MTDLEWTDEPPEEEGWYWIRNGWQAENNKSTYDRPVQVTEPYLGGKMSAWLHGDPFKLSEITKPVIWAGPIPCPSDPQDQ